MAQGQEKRRKGLKAAEITLNLSAQKNIARLAQELQNYSQPRLLNLGCGERFLGQEFLAKLANLKIIGLDLFLLPQVQVQGDAHYLPFCDETFDAVITQALLEHTREPGRVVREIKRCLKKGGLIYAEVPFFQGYHPDPEDFHRFTLSGLKLLLQDFKCLDSGICAGPSSALAWVLRDYLAGLLTGYSGGKMETIFRVLISWIFSPLKYLDKLFASKPSAINISSAFYFFGRKE